LATAAAALHVQAAARQLRAALQGAGSPSCWALRMASSQRCRASARLSETPRSSASVSSLSMSWGCEAMGCLLAELRPNAVLRRASGRLGILTAIAGAGSWMKGVTVGTGC